MLDNDNDRAVIGGNNPPPFDVDAHAAFVAKVDEFVAASNKWLKTEVDTEDLAKQLNDQITGLRGLWKKVDEARANAKKPHDDASKAVQAAFTPILNKLTKAADALKPKLAAYAKKKRDREEAERRAAQERARAEAEAAEQAARVAEKEGDIGALADAEQAKKDAEKAEKEASRKPSSGVGSASGGGRTVSLRKMKEVEVTNINVLFMHFRDHPDVHDLLRRLATAEVRAKDYDPADPIPGIKVIEREVMA